jgi:hypothetical protein
MAVVKAAISAVVAPLPSEMLVAAVFRVVRIPAKFACVIPIDCDPSCDVTTVNVVPALNNDTPLKSSEVMELSADVKALYSV